MFFLEQQINLQQYHDRSELQSPSCAMRHHRRIVLNCKVLLEQCTTAGGFVLQYTAYVFDGAYYLPFLCLLVLSHPPVFGTQFFTMMVRCATAVRACYALHGYTFGVPTFFVPQKIRTCNKAHLACMRTCSAVHDL